MKKIFLSVIILLTTSYVFGQEKAMKMNSFSSNWFIQIQGGGSVTFSDYHKRTDFTDFLSPHVALSVGNWFAPIMGARIQANGWESRNYDYLIDDNFKVKYIQANVDALFNISNMLSPSNPNKGFNVVGILGVGYAHGFKNKDRNIGASNYVVPRAGLQFNFRVSDVIGINIEGTGNLFPDSFNGISQGTKYDGTLNVMAGLNFKLGKQGYEVVNYIDPAEIRALQDEVNRQKLLVSETQGTVLDRDRQISQLKSELDAKPKVVVEQETVELEEVVMNAVVVFKLGKSTLQDNQEINIYNAAKFFQDNPNYDMIITGYADKATGSAAVNQRLSEQRAEAVKKIMIDKYGITANRITTQASGDKEQPFQIDAWNRVVIFTAVPRK